MSIGTIKAKGDILAVEFVPAQIIASGGSVVSDFVDIPPGFEFSSFRLASSSGSGVLTANFDSSLKMLDGDDSDSLSIQWAGSAIGASILGGTGRQFFVGSTGAATPKRLSGLRIERISGTIAVTVSACSGCRLVGIFRRRRLPVAA